MNIDFSEARTLKRFPLLDASRGLACIGVVAMHCRLEDLIPWYWGVMDFFFVMSGFLITRSLVSNCDKGRGTWSFLLYRALRLLPAYLTVMLLYAATVSILGTRDPAAVLPYVFLYQHTDLILGTKEVFPRVQEMAPYWSLILEEHFYLLWGFVFCGFAYRKLRITPVSLACIVLLMGLTLAMRKLGVHPWTLPGRYDGFLAGSVMGIIIFMPKKVQVSDKWVPRMLGCGWLLVIASAVYLVWRAVLSYQDYASYLAGTWLDIACYTIVSIVLVLGLVKMDIRRLHFGKLQNGLAFIGLISYEIYLAHYPLVTLLIKYFNFNYSFGRVLLFLSTLTLSSVVAYVMHKTLTVPALKKRESILAFFNRTFQPQPSTIIPRGEPVPVPCDEPADQPADSPR
jgi:peptidoglycan/LPS O-acetylase OafA/YrhL